MGLGWVVNRRYSDFECLRELLSKIYPAHVLPVLPDKGLSRKFDDEYLSKRMLWLEIFLNSLCQYEEFLNSLVLEAFLKAEDFEVARKEFDKRYFPKLEDGPAGLTSISGKLKFDSS